MKGGRDASASLPFVCRSFLVANSWITAYSHEVEENQGGCNHAGGLIRLNTDLVKKPMLQVEAVSVHEMAHPIAVSHDVRFIELLNAHVPM